ncbi:hypothetical protein IEI94_10565 [Halomonas sp. ML-15]|uniref:hypothetical protein n=1 Tax=Halomonas sp. ML-15 TaxID=2773305 RepID=UPI0017460E56|nr:hypothetical protein [Halomonas sp. ML-15]MBD3896293.1 hypothetical protein [Halomonas sp. ML-15]
MNKALRMMAASLMIAGLSACGSEQDAPGQSTDDTAQSDLSRDYTALVGEWRVVDFHQPGVSAMSAEQADSWLGARLRISDDWLALGEHYCESLTHIGEVLPVNQVRNDFQLQEGDLEPLEGREQVARHRLDCDDGDWATLGGTLLMLSDTRALAPWDGVLFELERDDGFRATGTEPAWNLAITESGMRLSVPFDDRDVSTELPEPEEGSREGSRVYHATTQGNYLRVVITPEACRDSMSGAPFETSVRVTRDGEVFDGCGGAMPVLSR